MWGWGWEGGCIGPYAAVGIAIYSHYQHDYRREERETRLLAVWRACTWPYSKQVLGFTPGFSVIVASPEPALVIR